jgi:hypothetical protein
MKAWGRNADWLKWVAAGFALVATASAEYELARAIGMNEWISAAVPGALDAYVVRALRSHREVLTAVLAMVGVNASSHLVTAGVLVVEWPLITAVSAIAPLVLWRVHALSTPGEARVRALWNVTEDEHTSTPPVPEHAPTSTETDTCPYCDTPDVVMGKHVYVCDRWRHVTACLCEHGGGLCLCSLECQSPCDGPSTDTFDEHADKAVSVASTHTSTCVMCGQEIPFLNMVLHMREAHPSPDDERGPVLAHWIEPDHPFPYQWDEHGTSTPVLRLVPDTAPEFDVTDPPLTISLPAPGTGEDLFAPDVHDYLMSVLNPQDKMSTPSTDQEHVTAGVLHPSDTVHMERARVLAGQSTGTPGVNEIKRELNVGTPRAQRLHAALKTEHARAQEGSTP